uniref:Opsin n=2 Tax=Nematostella vectensis TaxID=45351 RepID=A9UMX2_NEMVE|nr:TPA: opsin [Nematostella vectensis]
MENQEFSSVAYGMISLFYSFLAVTALTSNGVLVYLFLKYEQLRKTDKMLFLSIAVSDMIAAVATFPLGAIASAHERFRLRGVTCTYYAFASTTLGFNAMLHFTALSIQKYTSFSRPLRADTKKRHLLIVITILWLFSALWGLFPLLGWSSYAPETGNIVCSLNWTSTSKSSISYIISIFVLFFFIPLVVICVSYSLIFKTIRSMTHNAARTWGSDAQGTRDTFSAQVRSARLAFMMVLAFVFAWTPYAVVSIYSALLKPKLPLIAGILPPLFAKTSTLYNPLLCFIGSPPIRKCLFKTFYRRTHNRSNSGGSFRLRVLRYHRRSLVTMTSTLKCGAADPDIADTSVPTDS